MIYYRSTRDIKPAYDRITSAEAIKKGLADDGGLYVPEKYPTITDELFDTLLKMDYTDRAACILSLFLEDYDRKALAAAAREAYSEERFTGTGHAGPAPVVSLSDNINVIELWHGPTSAFKDMALQIMPRLLSLALAMTGEKRLAHILVATSGDTGKAALEGYRDVDGVKITVFYPVDGVSRMQKLQMQTTYGSNVNVVAVRGNFDDAQNGVKAIFSDKALAEKAEGQGFFFGSANSINWGRLAPQIVYYVSSYCDLVRSGKIRRGDKVNICVPTGNFGNIFAAYIAKLMGLPVKRLIVASNSNNVLTDFIATGIYNRTREFKKTISPSMDILISSNLERLLFTIGGAPLTDVLMDSLRSFGMYKAPDNLMELLRKDFSGYYLTESETEKCIRKTFEEKGYLVDTHTAVALGCAEKFISETGDTTPLLVVSTASPFKFAPAVSKALGLEKTDDDLQCMNRLAEYTGCRIPDPLSCVFGREIRFTETIDPDEMPEIPFRSR